MKNLPGFKEKIPTANEKEVKEFIDFLKSMKKVVRTFNKLEKSLRKPKPKK